MDLFNKNKPKKEEQDEVKDEEETTENDINDEDEEEEIETASKGRSNELQNMIIKLAITVVIVVVFFIVFLSILNGITHRGSSNYEQIETNMVNAAKKYFKDNPDRLPMSESQIVEVSASVLSELGYMKDLSKVTKKGVSCTGKVSISKTDNNYNYIPTLDCGDAYSSRTLVSAIKENSPYVSTGYGLYRMNGYSIFRGEEVNNFVSINSVMWRVVRIDNNDNLYLTLQGESLKKSSTWDNRYNIDTKFNSGINEYSASRIKEFLQKEYDNSLAVKKEKVGMVFTEDLRGKMMPYDVCIGKRSINSTKKNDNSVECTSMERNQKLGLLTISDYIMASTDPNCTTPSSPTCQNYNYLATKYNWWTGTAVTENTSEAFYITYAGRIKTKNTSSAEAVRPLIKITKLTMISGGTGLEKDPYIVK